MKHARISRWLAAAGGALLIPLWIPLCTIAVAALLWALLFAELNARENAVRAQAFERAALLASGYAGQVSRAAEDYDRTILGAAWSWRQSHGHFRLEPLVKQGIYPERFNLLLTDPEGRVITSLRAPPGFNVSRRDYFKRHRAGEATSLYVSRLENARLVGGPILIFSRPLLDQQLRFAGVAAAGVPPELLFSAKDNPSHNATDFVALVTNEGATMASWIGSQSGKPGSQPNTTHHDWTARGAWSQGRRLAPGAEFEDHRARFLAWQALPNLPLTLVAGIAEDEALAAFKSEKQIWMETATALSALLLALGGTGGIAFVRLRRRRRQEAANKETFRLALDGAREGFYMLRPVYGAAGQLLDFTIEECNERGAIFVGKPLEQVLGRRLSAVFAPRIAARVLAIHRAAMQRGFHESESRLRLHGGSVRWVRRRIVRASEGLAVTLTDITDARAHQADLKRLARTDALTGLPNRYWLQDALPAALARVREENGTLAVLYIDLDDFKDINNTRGHDAGDLVLQTVARRMTAALRPGDHIARLGGDEFTVILENGASPVDVGNVAARLINALSVPIMQGEIMLPPLSASIGVAIHPRDGDDIASLLKNADVAMYAAKDGGKGRFRFYCPDLSASIAHRVNLAHDLRLALQRNELVLHYQPRMDTRTQAVTGLEALVRWQHPERGLLTPNEFIPFAEEAGLIKELGSQVLEMACAQLHSWQDEGPVPCRLAINVSARQFDGGEFPQQVEEVLARHGLPGSSLEIEITESCMLEEPQRVSQDLRCLKALGVAIAVDDFGTGYSSLSQLQTLDVDVLKIDRSFIVDLTRSGQSLAFSRTIISMGHILGMRVVAEGVESMEQLEMLRSLGCDEVQGFLLCKPLTAGKLQDFLTRREQRPQVAAANWY